jgi:hypothetical protein
VPAIAWARGRLNPIAAFWLAYILTRPLGASIADWLGKPDHRGLGWGDGAVSGLALVAFLALVAYLTAGGRDVQARRPAIALRPQVAEEQRRARGPVSRGRSADRRERSRSEIRAAG